jgi:2-furoyl-CoA dehydrogenase large subunit
MIQIAGSHTLEAPQEVVWPRIFDPSTLMALIPGCQQLEQAGAGIYRGRIQVGIAAVGGAYDTLVQVVDQEPPRYCRFAGEVSGPTGMITGEATFTLAEAEPGCLVEYRAQALITGALAKLSPRLVEGVVQTLIKVGLANLNRQLREISCEASEGINCQDAKSAKVS